MARIGKAELVTPLLVMTSREQLWVAQDQDQRIRRLLMNLGVDEIEFGRKPVPSVSQPATKTLSISKRRRSAIRICLAELHDIGELEVIAPNRDRDEIGVRIDWKVVRTRVLLAIEL